MDVCNLVHPKRLSFSILFYLVVRILQRVRQVQLGIDARADLWKIDVWSPTPHKRSTVQPSLPSPNVLLKGEALNTMSAYLTTSSRRRDKLPSSATAQLPLWGESHVRKASKSPYLLRMFITAIAYPFFFLGCLKSPRLVRSILFC